MFNFFYKLLPGRVSLQNVHQEKLIIFLIRRNMRLIACQKTHQTFAQRKDRLICECAPARAHLCTVVPVWRGLSAASCTAGRWSAGCRSGSGRCGELWPLTVRSCPAQWGGQCRTGSWSAAPCQGNNPAGSSAAGQKAPNNEASRTTCLTFKVCRVHMVKQVKGCGLTSMLGLTGD